MRTYLSSITAIFTLSALILVTAARGEERQEEGIRLLREASALPDIGSFGSTPFRIKASFEISPVGNSTQDGTFTVTWASKDQYRIEFVIGDFQRIDVANGEKRWLHQKFGASQEWKGELLRGSFQRPVFALFSKAFDKYKVTSIEDETIEGTKARCVEVQQAKIYPERYCIDSQKGVLISTRFADPDDERGTLFDCQWRDYVKLGEKMIAQTIHCEEAGKGSYTIRFTELPKEIPPSELSFTQPADSYELKRCRGVLIPPRLVKQSPKVKYPKRRPAAPQNPVILWGILGEDGRLHNLAVAQSQGQLFDDAAAGPVEKWMYRPATCDGNPISSETSVQVNFKKR